MKLFDKSIYKILGLARNGQSIDLINRIANIDSYNLIVPKIYLGNIKESQNLSFLNKHNIQAIINCTENEPFHEYFDDKLKMRVSINDSRSNDNINNFKTQIDDTLDFIDKCLADDKNIYIHCYWGLMRSATIVASYIIKKYRIPKQDAINIVKEVRPAALSSIYNFNEVLDYVEKKYLFDSDSRNEL